MSRLPPLFLHSLQLIQPLCICLLFPLHSCKPQYFLPPPPLRYPIPWAPLRLQAEVHDGQVGYELCLPCSDASQCTHISTPSPCPVGPLLCRGSPSPNPASASVVYPLVVFSPSGGTPPGSAPCGGVHHLSLKPE